MLLNTIFGALALLSAMLMAWQWVVARRFPLHQRVAAVKPLPGVTLLKPLKGCDEATADCLHSWFAQSYEGPLQILFGVASAEDPVCAVVRDLMRDFPAVQAQLVVCGPLTGTNLKVSKLAALQKLARHDLLVISDADVRVPPDLLSNVLTPLADRQVGLVNCFYRLANPVTLAMQWEAIGINADFWSSVLQSRSLKPLDFALGAVMATRRQQIEQIGGFTALANCLADDYQLGKRVAASGCRIVLSGVVVECWSEPMGWSAVWKHQLRWARTIRVCQPLPYFFSILSNATLWPLVWLIFWPSWPALLFLIGSGVFRIATALDLQRRLTRQPLRLRYSTLVPIKDLLQAAVWLLAFLGNRIEWRGELMRLKPDGTLVRAKHPA